MAMAVSGLPASRMPPCNEGERWPVRPPQDCTLEVAGQAAREASVEEDYAPRLKRCSSLAEGKRLHAGISRIGRDGSRYLGNLLVQMYGKCGSLDDARDAFNRISRKNVFSWSILLAASVQNGNGREALRLFRQMDLEGEKPDDVTLTSLLGACSSLEAVEEGKLIHSRMHALGYSDDIIVGNSLVNMYGKCNQLHEARSVFDKMPRRSVVTWTVMVTAYAQHGHCEDALLCFRQMNCEGVEPNKVTFVTVLSACASIGALAEGQVNHARVAAAGLAQDLIVGSALVNFYGKCGSIDDARGVFDRIEGKNNVIWNAMIAAYVQHGYGSEALELYGNMEPQGLIPDVVTFSCILGACTTAEAGREIHAAILARGFESDRAVCNTLVNMYTKCGSMEDASCVFMRMQRRNVVSWTTMIAAYAQKELGKDSFELFQQMDLEGVKPSDITITSVLAGCCKMEGLAEGRAVHAAIVGTEFESDVEVGNSLIDMYAKCGSLKDAEDVFDKMQWRNVVSWTNMMVAYAQYGQALQALELVKRMDLEGIKQDEIAFSSILGACSTLHALPEGKAIHARTLANGFASGVTVGNALLYMYGICGSLEDATSVFEQLRVRDCNSYTAMSAAYGQHCRSDDAFNMFYEMNVEGMEPREATFTSVFQACSHAGLLDKAVEYFVSMGEYQGMKATAEHYGCLVDLLGRTGFLREAEDLIDNMPFQPDVVAWRSLLSACRTHRNKNREAIRAAENAFELHPSGSSPYVLLSNMYKS